jgi:hypothetical protein
MAFVIVHDMTAPYLSDSVLMFLHFLFLHPFQSFKFCILQMLPS